MQEMTFIQALTKTGLLLPSDKRTVEVKALTEQDRLDLARAIEKECGIRCVKQSGEPYVS